MREDGTVTDTTREARPRGIPAALTIWTESSESPISLRVIVVWEASLLRIDVEASEVQS